jgi:hypothetical protein
LLGWPWISRRPPSSSCSDRTVRGRRPSTGLGYGRSERFTPADGAALEPRAYELPKQLQVNHWALAGDWSIGRESVVLDHAGASIAFRFYARGGHLVPPGARVAEAQPYLHECDGRSPSAYCLMPRPWGSSAGVDVDQDERFGTAGCTNSYASMTGSAREPRDHLPPVRRRGVRIHLRLGRSPPNKARLKGLAPESSAGPAFAPRRVSRRAEVQPRFARKARIRRRLASVEDRLLRGRIVEAISPLSALRAGGRRVARSYTAELAG